MNLRKIFLISFSLIALEATINNNEIKAATTGTIVGGDFFILDSWMGKLQVI